MNKLMTHIVAGYPSLEESKQIGLTMLKFGVNFLEIQIPFSDPVADGKTIAKANQIALENGTKLKDCFDLAAEFVVSSDNPILFMTYYNVIYKYGVEEFMVKCKELGIYGLIVPDIPYDSSDGELFLEQASMNNIHVIFVISPITPEDRLKQIGERASGFVYCVSKFGLTGTGGFEVDSLQDYLDNVRKYIEVPLALGFGIQSIEDVKKVNQVVDMAVIGSELIKKYS
jgi:tryptophan synthase alpha subunit